MSLVCLNGPAYAYLQEYHTEPLQELKEPSRCQGRFELISFDRFEDRNTDFPKCPLLTVVRVVSLEDPKLLLLVRRQGGGNSFAIGSFWVYHRWSRAKWYIEACWRLAT